MLEIDASTLEGGGQLTRLALTLSALTLRPIHLRNIRANRGSFRSRPHTADNANKHVGSGGTNDRSRLTQGLTRRDLDNDDLYVDKGKERGMGRGKDRRGENTRGKSREKASSKGKVEGGLKESHLAALHFLAAASDALVEGDQIGSREVVFRPRRRVGVDELAPKIMVDNGKARRRVVTIELKKPGSVWLIWQAIYPYIVFGLCRRRDCQQPDGKDTEHTASCGTGIQNAQEGSMKEDEDSIEFILRGGTNVDKSMSLEYINQVFLPTCRKIGLPGFRVECVKRGWAGGHGEIGEVRIVMDLVVPVTATDARAAGEEGDVSSSAEYDKGTITNEMGQKKKKENKEMEEKAEEDEKGENPENPEKQQTAKKAYKISDHPFTLLPFSLTDRGTITSITINVLASTPELIETVQSRAKLKLRDALDLYFSDLGDNNPNDDGNASSGGWDTTRARNTGYGRDIQINTNISEPSGHLSRLYILLVAHTNTDMELGHDFLGGKSPKNEREMDVIIDRACTRVVEGFMHEIRRNAVVDEFMEDQIVVFRGLAGGRSVVGSGKDSVGEGEESLHARTARWVVGEVLEGVQVDAGGIVGVGMNGEVKEGEVTVGDLTGKVGGLRIV